MSWSPTANTINLVKLKVPRDQIRAPQFEMEYGVLSSIVFCQLTFSKHKGFPGSGAPAGIWKKRYKLYRFLFFEENTFNNQKCFCTWNNESDFSLSNAKLFQAELLGTINNSRNSAFGKNNICWKVLRHRNSLTFKVVLPFFYSLCEGKKGCFGKL